MLVNTNIVLRSENKTVKLDINTLCKMLGLETAELSVELIQNGTKLIATIVTNEEYPAINVDAEDKNETEIYLSGFELPNEDYPNSITARLYAGYSDIETSEPVCLIRHAVRDDSTPDTPVEPEHPLHKLVYIDPSLAESRDWLRAGEEAIIEHKEDEV